MVKNWKQIIIKLKIILNNMLTKSKIQSIKEELEIANQYRESLNNLMDKYLIEDNIFIYKNSQLFESTSGYFIEKYIFDNLSDAVNACLADFDQSGIRIINNEKFIVGNIKNLISECNRDEKIFDIQQLKEWR